MPNFEYFNRYFNFKASPKGFFGNSGIVIDYENKKLKKQMM
jgi:hypothetical protein